MSNNGLQIDKKKEPKKILRNTFYSFLSSASLYIYAIITSFLIARQISQEIWGFLILATSYLAIITTLLYFVPPGLDFSLLYFIPHFQSLKKLKSLKSFLLKTFILKLVAVFLFFILFLLLINFSATLFSLNLGSYVILLYILSPLVIINGLNSFFNSFKIGYDLFKYHFLSNIIKFSVNIVGLLLYFILSDEINIEVIAIINVLSFLVPIIIDCFVFSYKLFKIKPIGEEGLKFKETIKMVLNYGSYISINSAAAQLWIQSKLQAIGVFETSEWVTGFNIGEHYSEIPKIFLNAISNPMRISFTRLYSKGEKEQISKISKIIVSYTIFVVLLIDGILFLVTNFFLFLVYGETYLIYSNLVKLIILSIGFGVFPKLFNMLLHVTNKVKVVPFSTLIYYSIRSFLFFTGLTFFGLNGAVIGLIIANIILLFLSCIFIKKIFRIDVDMVKIFLQYLIFYLSLGTSLFLGYLFLNNLNMMFLDFFNLSFFNHLPLFTIGIFIVVYFLLNLIFKIFTKKDAEYIELIFTKENISHNFIRKLSRLLKYILR